MQVEPQVHRNIVDAGHPLSDEDQDGVITRTVSLRSTLTMEGPCKQLRGGSGAPVHSKLTGFPIAAYLLVVGVDAASMIGGDHRTWSRELWHVGTYVFVAGAVGSVMTALTSFRNAWMSSDAGTQPGRSTKAHAATMIGVTVLVLVAVVWRLTGYHSESATPVDIMMLSVVIAWLVSLGGNVDSTLANDYRSRVDLADDVPSGASPKTACSQSGTPIGIPSWDSGVFGSRIAADTAERPSRAKGST